MGDSSEAYTPIMILMRDLEGRVVYEVWRTAPAAGKATSDAHVDSPIHSKAQARGIAEASGFYLVQEGEIWEHLPEE
jgi:hypothetical protein